jgi:predicted porin
MVSYHGFLTSVALAAALNAPAFAQDGVQIYGLLDVFAGSLKSSSMTERTTTVNNGGLTTSYIGFRGREDLGSGLSALFSLESYLRVDLGAAGRFNGDPLFARTAIVGVEGSGGKVTLGRNANPYFVSTLLFNAGRDSFTFSPMILHTFIASGLGPTSVQGDTAWSNSVLYSSPSVGGATANIVYAYGEEPGRSGQANYGVNLTYFNGNFSSSVAAQRVGVQTSLTNGATRQSAWQLGAAYDFKHLKVFGQVQRVANNNNVDDDTYSVGATVPLGGGSMFLSAAQTKRSAPLRSNRERETYSVGYDYILSKRTDIYAAAMRDKVTAVPSGSSFGIGIRHRF